MQTVRQFRLCNERRLAIGGIPEPSIEIDLILIETLEMPLYQLLAEQDNELSRDLQDRLAAIVLRRLEREPLAYILGHREFYETDLSVGPAVMVPRQETELLVDQAIRLGVNRYPQRPPIVADIGTGSGSIAINIALNLAGAQVLATDCSLDALEIARKNIQKYGLQERIVLGVGDLLLPVDGPIDIIISNLPYIPSKRLDLLQEEIRWEPTIALDGGYDGLVLIRRLLSQAVTKLARDGSIVLEIDCFQGQEVKNLSKNLFPGATVSITQDLAGLDRVLTVVMTSDAVDQSVV